MKTKYTPGQERKAQDLAVDLGHLNIGIQSLVDLYASAPELLALVKELRDLTLSERGARTHFTLCVDRIIAKAEGK